MEVVNDLSRSAVIRTAKLATLPAGFARRTALGTSQQNRRCAQNWHTRPELRDPPDRLR